MAEPSRRNSGLKATWNSRDPRPLRKYPGAALGGARWHRAAQHHGVSVAFGSDRGADLAAHTLDIAQVGHTVWSGGVPTLIMLASVPATAAATSAVAGMRPDGRRPREFGQTGLDDRRLAGCDTRHLVGVDVDTDDRVTVTRQARSCNDANVPEPKDANLHLPLLRDRRGKEIHYNTMSLSL